MGGLAISAMAVRKIIFVLVPALLIGVSWGDNGLANNLERNTQATKWTWGGRSWSCASWTGACERELVGESASNETVPTGGSERELKISPSTYITRLRSTQKQCPASELICPDAAIRAEASNTSNTPFIMIAIFHECEGKEILISGSQTLLQCAAACRGKSDYFIHKGTRCFCELVEKCKQKTNNKYYLYKQHRYTHDAPYGSEKDLRVVLDTAFPSGFGWVRRYNRRYFQQYLPQYPAYASTGDLSPQPAGYTCKKRNGWTFIEGPATYALVTYYKLACKASLPGTGTRQWINKKLNARLFITNSKSNKACFNDYKRASCRHVVRALNEIPAHDIHKYPMFVDAFGIV